MKGDVIVDEAAFHNWLMGHCRRLLKLMNEGVVLPNLRTDREANPFAPRSKGAKTRKVVRAFTTPPEYILMEMKTDLRLAIQNHDWEEMAANFFVLARAMKYF